MRVLDSRTHALEIARVRSGGFDALLDHYEERITSLYGDGAPDCIIVCFPEEVASLRVQNRRLSYREQRVLQRVQEGEDQEQAELFDDFSRQERIAAAELFPQAEELLFRSFHRALKARCMSLGHGHPVPIQVIREHTYSPESKKQNEATRAWNLSTALFYKSSNIPWHPADLRTGGCFAGISFHHLKRRGGNLMYASLAQAYSTESEPFALKGKAIASEQVRNKQPFLTAEQAGDLAEKIVREYVARTGAMPSSLVLHKTSQYQPEEIEGFMGVAGGAVPAVELVWIRPTGLRMVRKGDQPPNRGTLLRVGSANSFLFTTGYVPWWKQYPGPHIPAPLEFGSPFETDLAERAREILTLTKMNWNSADGLGRHPITLSFARKVGAVMTELNSDDHLNPYYRFYM